MSQREKRHQRRPKYFDEADEHKLDDNCNQVDDPHVQIDFDSPVPQKVTKKATKRKSTTYYDSDKGSEDEDYSPTKSKYKEDSSDDDFEPASKKNKSSKVSFFNN